MGSVITNRWTASSASWALDPMVTLLVIGSAEKTHLVDQIQHICLALPHRNFKIEHVLGMEEGIEALRSADYAVGLLDSEAMEESCWALLEIARACQISTPMVIVTQRDDRVTTEQWLEAGASDVLGLSYLSPPLFERVVFHGLEKQKHAQEVGKLKQQIQLAGRCSRDGLWVWDPRSSEMFLSARWREMMGQPSEDMVAGMDTWLDTVHPDDRERVQASLYQFMTGRAPAWEMEYRAIHNDGSMHWVVNVGLGNRDENNRVNSMVGWLIDLKDRTASHDALTSLPNRNLFLEQLHDALHRSKRQDDFNFAVIYIDLDHFKVVNDSLGHAAGDALLMQVATRLRASIRSLDTVARISPDETTTFTPIPLSQKNVVARFGGDEFAVLLDNVKTPREAAVVAERMQELLQTPFDLNGQEIFSSASIGVAHSQKRYENAEEMLRDADIAMYRSKEQGKACYTLFDSGMHEEVKDRLALETDLRKAIERDEVMLYYQPIVTLQNERTIGFEALLRWNHPERGWISPAMFVPVAEETGLIVKLGAWVMEKAAEQLHLWHTTIDPSLYMSINVSTKQLIQPHFAQNLEAVLLLKGVNPDRIRIEVTESSIMNNQQMATRALEQIRQTGAKVQIDDFGTGYSSLSRLHLLPLDALKIDRSFVMEMDSNRTQEGIVGAIVALAHTLGLDLVAEGIEESNQGHYLRQLGCQFGQGYFYGRPMPPEKVPALLQARPTSTPLY